MNNKLIIILSFIMLIKVGKMKFYKQIKRKKNNNNNLKYNNSNLKNLV